MQHQNKIVNRSKQLVVNKKIFIKSAWVLLSLFPNPKSLFSNTHLSYFDSKIQQICRCLIHILENRTVFYFFCNLYRNFYKYMKKKKYLSVILYQFFLLTIIKQSYRRVKSTDIRILLIYREKQEMSFAVFFIFIYLFL